MTDDATALAGLRILVVEDTLLVADVICDFLESCGCIVVGPVARLPDALRLVHNEQIDCALLDVNLAGELSFPVATLLKAHNVPYVFVTGYDDSALFPAEFRSIPRITKPFYYTTFLKTLVKEFGEHRLTPPVHLIKGRYE